jgi:hypothetical protein
MIMFLLLVLAIGVYKLISLNLKGITEEKKEFLRFQGADGGVYAVAGWMYYYKRFDLPKEVTETSSYKAQVRVLANTVRYPEGYSSLWKGFDARINSKSDNLEVEAVVFVPVAPAGYGNE